MVDNTETIALTETEWRNIIDDIEQGKAVLLIGPDFMLFENKPIYTYLQAELLKSNESDISFYYERDGLFMFSSDSAKLRVIREINRLYDSLTPDETVLSRIAQIPFPLIISLNPDHFLSQVLYEKGIRHRSQYNRANERIDVEKPATTAPLIYNLFGSITQDDSLVLDYDDVYRLLKWTFDEGNLPPKLLQCYRQARTCIFLGFQFDRWYSQLLLKILNGEGKKEQHIAIRRPDKADAEAFIMRQFNIKFIGDQLNLIDEIFDRYAIKYAVKPVDDTPVSPNGVQVIRQVQKGDLGRALDVLEQRSEGTDFGDAIIALQARYSRLESGRERTDSRDYQTELNAIIHTVISYAKRLH